jgi:hypothetical protein
VRHEQIKALQIQEPAEGHNIAFDETDILKVRTIITHFEGQDNNHDTGAGNYFINESLP